MKHLTAVLVLLSVLAAPSSAQFKVDIPKSLERISPITRDEQGDVDYVFSAMLVTFDAASITELALSKRAIASGRVEEWNPVYRELFKHEPLDWVYKVGMTALVNYCAKGMYRENKTVGYLFAGAATVGYSWITYHNYRLTMQVGL